ncbi:hypothetical protein TWF506_006397 [Arthrobotrys conoides]|uniref:Glycoprotein n=1 Tax=Arthrobotrys conoides TaxID=74498 RepID=A0AAN8N944_9PEZI
METVRSSKANITVFFLFLYSLLATVKAELSKELFLRYVPPDLDTTVQVSVGTERPEVENVLETGSANIITIINGTSYCLTDPGDRIQPYTNRTIQNFATLEECSDSNMAQKWLAWPGIKGEIFTRAPKHPPYCQDPQYPYYSVNHTHYGMRGLKNAETGRCIHGDSSYPGGEVEIPDYDRLAARDDYFGFVYLSEYCPTKDQDPTTLSGRYSVRNALVGSGYDFIGEDANPRWTYPDTKEVLYFDQPTLSSRTWTCSKLPSTRQDNRTIASSEPDPYEAEYRTKTLIIPHLIELKIKKKKFNPALFGCASNTNEHFPTFSPSPIEAVLSKYGETVEEIKKCHRETTDAWNREVEFYKDLAYCWSLGGLLTLFSVCQPYLQEGGKIAVLSYAEKYYKGSQPDLKVCTEGKDWIVL